MAENGRKWTGGEWRVGYDEVAGCPTVVVGTNKWNEGRVCSLPYVFVEERDANAHLIAAAPEMFDALREAIEYLDAGRPDTAESVLNNEGRAALRKAEGRYEA